MTSKTAMPTYRAVALFFGVLVALQFAWMARSVLLIAFLGLLFGIGLSAGVDWMENRWKVKRGLGAAFLVILVLGAVVGIGAALAPMLRSQTRELSQKLPQAVDGIEAILAANPDLLSTVPREETRPSPVPKLEPAPGEPSEERTNPTRAEGRSNEPTGEASSKPDEGQQAKKSVRRMLAGQLQGFAKFLFPFVSSTIAIIGGFIFVIFIALYIAAEKDMYYRGVLHLFSHGRRERVAEFLKTAGYSLKRWLVARLIAMVVIGALTTGILTLLQVRAAVALGILAGILEFIPFFGPIASAIPAIAIAFTDSPQKALWVVMAFVVIQQIEGNLLSPLLLEKRVDIPPFLTLVGVATFGAVFGILGLLVAEPLLVTILIAVKMIYVEDVIGDEVIEEQT